MVDFPNPPRRGTGAVMRSVAPVYSTIRISCDVTPVTGVNHFGGAKVPTTMPDVRAFAYGTADANAAVAGFGTKTKPNVLHTNLSQAYRVPGQGAMNIESIAFLPAPFITIPVATLPATDLNDIVDDTPGRQYITDDFKSGYLRSAALGWIAECYVPYFQYGESGQKTYLGSLALMPSGRQVYDGRQSALHGAPFVWAGDGGIEWSADGNKSNLIVGLELRRNIANQAWASTGATAQLFTDVSAALGVSNAAAPASGAWVFNLDFKVIALGALTAPINA